MFRKLWFKLFLLNLSSLFLAGCISSTIETPSGPTFEYSWVMIHDYSKAGIQIGPKYDADGAHVSVYWWLNCNPVCENEGYFKLIPLAKGSVNGFSIILRPDGYHCYYNGSDVFQKKIDIPNPHYETGTEVTTQ